MQYRYFTNLNNSILLIFIIEYIKDKFVAIYYKKILHIYTNSPINVDNITRKFILNLWYQR